MTAFNAGQRQHVRQAEKQAKIDESLNKTVVVTLMNDQQGRRWMHDKLVLCHIFQSTHTGNALQTAFLEGERNVGLRFLADIMEHCPDQYVTMMREANARDRAADQRRTDRNDADGVGDEDERADSTNGQEARRV